MIDTTSPRQVRRSNNKLGEDAMTTNDRSGYTGYDYAKQIEAEQAPLRPSQVAIVRAQILSAVLGGLIALAWWRFGEGESFMAARAGCLAVGSVLLVPLGIRYMRKTNGIQAASNRRLGGRECEGSETLDSLNGSTEGGAGDVFWCSTLSIIPGGRLLFVIGKLVMIKLGYTKIDDQGMTL
jgi:hypothetical protein